RHHVREALGVGHRVAQGHAVGGAAVGPHDDREAPHGGAGLVGRERARGGEGCREQQGKAGHGVGSFLSTRVYWSSEGGSSRRAAPALRAAACTTSSTANGTSAATRWKRS